MVDGFLHRQDRSDAGIGACQHGAPLVTGAVGEVQSEPLAQLRPHATLAAAGKFRVAFQAIQLQEGGLFFARIPSYGWRACSTHT